MGYVYKKIIYAKLDSLHTLNCQVCDSETVKFATPKLYSLGAVH